MLFLLACHTEPEDTKVVQGTTDDSTQTDDTAAEDTGSPVAEGCRADPGDPDKDRAVLVSFPYDERARQSELWASWTLAGDGTLTAAQSQFAMGRAVYGEVVFTPDGSVAIAPQEDGTMGIYAEGMVVEAALGDIYAEHIVMDPSGEKAWAIDGNWPDNGGGIYPLTIACDTPTVTVERRWLAAKLPAAMIPFGESWIIVGREIAGSDPDSDVVMVDAEGNLLAESDAFGDNDAVVTSAVLTRDGRYLLVADNSEFSSGPTRVQVVEVGENTLTAVQTISTEDPVAMFVSPDDDRVVVLSGYANALFVLNRSDNDAAPFSSVGEPDYLGMTPQLPGEGALIERGALKGLLLVTEVEGIRQVMIDGGVTDWGLVISGDGIEDIPGALGVMP